MDERHGAMEDDEKKTDFDACLMGWSLCDLRNEKGDIWPVILAEVWDDKRGRWDNGTRIRTGVIRSMPVPPLQFGDIVETKTSSYILGRPSDTTIQ
ncbi:hypothetical protein F7D01_13865 [Erythrobacter sp. 3-20A1M]|uniref:hypothetical protein n=1 Tax=Erythrobacter sp. 3-20A1M TaxID=2653850 RepID=UPI001BFC1CAF|nr:hypothetical protein [Erythrobacter sp. 3-20A1M]QWC58009.1 hypothetical protein F7D01_13865 [Erythrobacter sp. 3-20A1M]